MPSSTSERNKFLAKAMGDCYHSFKGSINGRECVNCGEEFWACETSSANRKYNFSNWTNFGRLWEWCKTQDWLGNFVRFANSKAGTEFLGGFICPIYTNPDKFANTLYEYLSTKNE